MIGASHGILLGNFTCSLKSKGEGDRGILFSVTVQTSHKLLLVHSPCGNITVHTSSPPSLFSYRQPGDPGTASVTTSGSVFDFQPPLTVFLGAHTPRIKLNYHCLCLAESTHRLPSHATWPWRMFFFFWVGSHNILHRISRYLCPSWLVLHRFLEDDSLLLCPITTRSVCKQQPQ